MNNSTNKKRIPFYVIVLLFGLALLFNWLFYTDRLEYQELKRVKSPYDNVELVSYLGNCGALCSWTIKVNLETPEGKVILAKIFYAMHCGAVDIEWLDRQHARINGITLNVFKDRFDAREKDGSMCPENS